MLNINALETIIKDYKQDFKRIHADEIYKWKAVKHFQDNWDIKADDFPAMLNTSLGKAYNLLDSRNFFPKGMIYAIAQKDQEAVRTMFIDLFDELQSVTDRIKNFMESAERLRLKYGGGAWKMHYQNAYAVSIYLFFRYPEKYFIYKFRKFKDFGLKINYPITPKMGDIEDVQKYFKMCNEVLEVIKRDKELLDISKNRLTNDDYPDNNFHLLTDDIIYFGKIKIIKQDTWWPSEDEYHPGISKEKWKQLLSDKKIFNSDSIIIMKRMLDIGGEATCTQLSLKYGESTNYYNSGSSYLAKRIWKAVKCRVLVNNNENSRWWPILYTGKHADEKISGSYIWRLRPELMDALKETDFININNIHQKPPVNYWWLNANPKIWQFSDLRVGEEEGYTLLNENGNKRRIYKNFLDAKEGDIVIGYEATPVKQIVAVCIISGENDGTSIYFKKVEGLSIPIDYNVIKDVKELQNMECLVNPNGSLFKLTKDEYDLLLDIIREQNPLSSSAQDKLYKPYTKNDFLENVYLKEDDYNSLTALLEYKKNVILQGAPGVGKTFTAKHLAYSILKYEDDSKIKIVQFHQNYSYEDFIMGYKPEESGFKLCPGIFYQFCLLAENNPDDKYFFIIDEINRGNLSKIFGELLMMIEKDYRGTKITLAYNHLTFSVPENIYIIGMMNTADRSSLSNIDYALRRRFSFFNMRPAFDSEGFISYRKSLNSEALDDLIEELKKLNEEIENDDSLGEGFCIGHSYFCGQNECTEEWLSDVIEYDLIPMLNEYWFDDKAKAKKWAEKLRGVIND